MFSTLKYLIKKHRPVIMRQETFDQCLCAAAAVAINTSDKHTKSAINPVIHDLERLRANTWDQDKITHMQEWLRSNFIKEDSHDNQAD